MSISTKYSHSEFVFVGKFLTRRVLNIDASICCPPARPFSCYRAGSFITIVGSEGCCVIDDTKHCLAVAWLPTNSPTLP